MSHISFNLLKRPWKIGLKVKLAFHWYLAWDPYQIPMPLIHTNMRTEVIHKPLQYLRKILSTPFHDSFSRFQQIVGVHTFQAYSEQIKVSQLSNSTPTSKPNSTSVGLSRSWLCFPKEEEGRTNPHLAFSRRNVPSFLGTVLWVSGGCMEIVWSVLVGVWQVSFGCLEGVVRVSGRCLKGVWGKSMGCLNGILVSQDCWSQDRSSQDR